MAKKTASVRNKTDSELEHTLNLLYDRFEVKSLSFKDLQVSPLAEERLPKYRSFLFTHKEKLEDLLTFEVKTGREHLTTSKRFITTLLSQLEISEKIFNLFTPAEIFSRFAKVRPDYKFKVTVDKQDHVLLGTMVDSRKILKVNKVLDILRKDQRLLKLEYRDGVISSRLNNTESFTVEHDSAYNKRFEFRLPIDGCSVPSFNLALLRQVCQNGASMAIKEYKTDAIITDNDGDHLERIIKSFNNDQGFDNLEKRLNVAAVTPCSLRELGQFESLIERSCPNRDNSNNLVSIIEKYAGSPRRKHGVLSLRHLAESELKDTNCKLNMADLFNIGTELLTHHPEVLTKHEQFNLNLAKLVTRPLDFEELETRPAQIRQFYLDDFVEAAEKDQYEDEYAEDEGMDYDASEFYRF